MKSRAYRARETRLNQIAERLESAGRFTIHTRIKRAKARTQAKLANTAERWEQMAATPMDQRPGGFPGDPFNGVKKVSLG